MQPLQARTTSTRRGPAAHLDTGEGPGSAALFVHGVGTGASLWGRVIEALSAERRCIALDLPLHGRTPPVADYSLGAMADFVVDFCEALGLSGVDLVGNDTGGAIAQIVAARRPDLLRSVVLTNCDSHDNVPPAAMLPMVLLARAGLAAPLQRFIAGNPRRARRLMYGRVCESVENLPLELVADWVEPLAGTWERAREFQRWLAALRPDDVLDAERSLSGVRVPTLIVWGTADRFFDVRWAHRLHDLLPGARPVVEVPGARLLFPRERPHALVEPLREFWEQLS